MATKVNGLGYLSNRDYVREALAYLKSIDKSLGRIADALEKTKGEDKRDDKGGAQEGSI